MPRSARSKETQALHFRLKGPAVPSELRDLVASMTDRAKLRPEAISTDPAVPELHLLIQRFPLIRQRRILPNVHDLKSPLPAVVTIRQVVTADIDSRMPSQLGGANHPTFRNSAGR